MKIKLNSYFCWIIELNWNYLFNVGYVHSIVYTCTINTRTRLHVNWSRRIKNKRKHYWRRLFLLFYRKTLAKKKKRSKENGLRGKLWIDMKDFCDDFEKAERKRSYTKHREHIRFVKTAWNIYRTHWRIYKTLTLLMQFEQVQNHGSLKNVNEILYVPYLVLQNVVQKVLQNWHMYSSTNSSIDYLELFMSNSFHFSKGGVHVFCLFKPSATYCYESHLFDKTNLHENCLTKICQNIGKIICTTMLFSWRHRKIKTSYAARD